MVDLDEPAWRSALHLWRQLWIAERLGDVPFEKPTAELLSQLENTSAPGRDVPALQRLETLVEVLIQTEWRERKERVGGLSAMRGLCETQADVIALAAQLHAATIDWTVKPEILASLSSTQIIALRYGEALAGSLEHRLIELGAAGWSSDHVLAAVADLLNSADANLRLVAVPLIRAGGLRSGWASSWRAILDRARRDPDADVRREALRIRTAAE